MQFLQNYLWCTFFNCTRWLICLLLALHLLRNVHKTQTNVNILNAILTALPVSYNQSKRERIFHAFQMCIFQILFALVYSFSIPVHAKDKVQKSALNFAKTEYHHRTLRPACPVSPLLQLVCEMCGLHCSLILTSWKWGVRQKASSLSWNFNYH